MVNNKSVFSEIPKGAFLSETQYYQVNNNNGLVLDVTNERGFPFTISKGIVEEGIFTAHQFKETREVTRTELIDIFSQVGDTVFTVQYNKQPKPEDINEAIAQANKGRILPIKDIQKIVKDAYKGEERILIGYLIKTETGFGRSNVIDLQIERGKGEHDNRIRQVDHRTIKSLISRNIKWIIKK